MVRKKRRRRSSRRNAVKMMRYVKRQRRRRKRLHPTRRRQEDLAILGVVASLPLLVFVGVPAAVIAGVASGGAAIASKGSPPLGATKRKNVSRKRADTSMRGSDLIKLQKRRMSCSDACKYSTHKKSTCDCVCGGRDHGSWATGVQGSTTPNKPPRRRG